MYRHLVTGFSLKFGDFVKQGDPVARVIYAPLSSFTHLHFQVDFFSNSTQVNVPTAFMEISAPGRSEGFPEVGDTYISQNAPVGIEAFPSQPLVGTGSLSLSLFPNPFGPSTSLCFTLKAPQAQTDLEIYSASGALVKKLWARSLLDPGNYRVDWSAAQAARGVYVCRLRADGKSVSRRLYKN
jgi:murein DD-endopeptidase MepM/ murein hydrolase activator NlpD